MLVFDTPIMSRNDLREFELALRETFNVKTFSGHRFEVIQQEFPSQVEQATAISSWCDGYMANFVSVLICPRSFYCEVTPNEAKLSREADGTPGFYMTMIRKEALR
jgi:hypothetical protein